MASHYPQDPYELLEGYFIRGSIKYHRRVVVVGGIMVISSPRVGDRGFTCMEGDYIAEYMVTHQMEHSTSSHSLKTLQRIRYQIREVSIRVKHLTIWELVTDNPFFSVVIGITLGISHGSEHH